MPVQLYTAPTVEPISLNEAKTHLRIDSDNIAEDDFIANLIAAAREYCQNKTNRQFITATYKLSFCQFPIKEICVPWPKLIAVSGITYVDYSGITQTVSSSDYIVDTQSEPGHIVPAYNTYWPGAREQANSVIVTYAAGYGPTAASVPAGIKQAMLLMVGQLYMVREPDAVDTSIVDALLGSYQLPEVA